ncbi:MAG TPA: HAD hydrolase family protein [Opitutaceae bacterium]|jgi:3-deoxy-D-manno-octulosonate 8-phosphate phosphatase (KDO 8-P phosphatase)|nr:HAD hydrolase family protein [Opitutaceae bacterium]
MDGLSEESRLPWRAIRLFAMDVDGVLTDGRVGISSAEGEEIKFFSILDGLGLVGLPALGVAAAWISGRPSRATERRAAELRIPHLIQSRTDKLAALQELAASLKLDAAACAYMGDDVIDAPAIAWSGIGISVPGGMPAALMAARYVTHRAAGFGAVREICDHLQAAHRPPPAP